MQLRVLKHFVAPGVCTYVEKRIASSCINASRYIVFQNMPATSCLLKRKYGQLRSVYITRAGLVHVRRINSPSCVTAAYRRLHKQCRLCAGTGMIRGCYTTLILTILRLFMIRPRTADPFAHSPLTCVHPFNTPKLRAMLFFHECMDLSIYFTYPIFPSTLR